MGATRADCEDLVSSTREQDGVIADATEEFSSVGQLGQRNSQGEIRPRSLRRVRHLRLAFAEEQLVRIPL